MLRAQLHHSIEQRLNPEEKWGALEHLGPAKRGSLRFRTFCTFLAPRFPLLNGECLGGFG